MTTFAGQTMTERERDASRKRKSREAGRDITIPEVAEPRRREDALADHYLFLRTYFPIIFFQDFTPARKDMAESIIHAARYGGDQAIAGPRADGKTKLAMFLSLFLIIKGMIRFPVVIGKSSNKAMVELKNIKFEIEHNDLFAADFPEICVPVRELGSWSSNARKQTHNGKHTLMEWDTDHIILPTVEGSACSGAIMASVGIEGGIRGMNYRNVRPDLAILDDIDDRDSARSDMQTETRERTIDEDIAGLGGPDKRIARVMLCTLINRTCVAATFTDRTKRPSWRGRRNRSLVTLPTHIDLWEKYVALRRDRDADTDPLARVASQFYISNRAKMDDGAVLGNPQRFSGMLAEDGQPLELSALQQCYNLIADLGQDAFDTEYQNDPPEDRAIEASQINERLVRSRLSGLEHFIAPANTKYLTAFIDVGQYWLHYAVCAWQPGMIGDVIDYGVEEVVEPLKNGVEKSILTALRTWRDRMRNECPYVKETGEPIDLSDFGLIQVDAGHWNTVIYEFVLESGAPFRASIGDPQFRQPAKKTKDKRPGSDGWYESRQPIAGRRDHLWVINMESNRWKRRIHDGFLTEPREANNSRRRGSIVAYGSDTQAHQKFASHVCSEEYIRKFVEGTKGETWVWHKKHPSNHWLDCLYGNAVAASIMGVNLYGAGGVQPSQPNRLKVTGTWTRR